MFQRMTFSLSTLAAIFSVQLALAVATSGTTLYDGNPGGRGAGHLNQGAAAIPDHPPSTGTGQAHLAKAEGYYAIKQCSLALDEYARAGASLRRNPDAVLHYAECDLEEGNAARATAILAQLPASDGERHFAAGEMLVRHRSFAAAAEEFGKARPFYRDLYAAAYDQTLAYYNAGNFAAAINTANGLLNQGHRTAELADLAGEAYLKNHQTQEAYNAFRVATGIDPQNEDSYVDLCSLSLDMEKFDLGVEIADVGLKHLPESSRLHLQRGALLAMKGDFDRAQQDFSAAASLAPGEVTPLVSEGVLAMQTDHLDQSVDILHRAATQAPGSYLAQYWYAVALLRNGATPGSTAGDQALSALEASVRSNPDFWHSQADLGKVLLDNSKVEPAIGHLERAATLNPDATTPLYLLAQAYRRKGDTERAQALIVRVSKMQAEDREGLTSDLKHLVIEGTNSRANWDGQSRSGAAT